MKPSGNVLKCRRCGRCCIESQGHLQATLEDLDRWKKEGRKDILQFAYVMLNSFADLWFDPTTGEELSDCPFLRKLGRAKYECTIHGTAPEQCADWWCILCEDKSELSVGAQIAFGAAYYVISDSPRCPECGKGNICRLHEFVCKHWLQRIVAYYSKRT